MSQYLSTLGYLLSSIDKASLNDVLVVKIFFKFVEINYHDGTTESKTSTGFTSTRYLVVSALAMLFSGQNFLFSTFR